MPSRRHSTHAAAAPPAARGRRAAAAACLLGAALLTAIAAGRLHALWTHLPQPSLRRLDPAALRSARTALAGTARDAMLLVALSDQFTEALRRPDRVGRLLEDAHTVAPTVRAAGVVRLQLAAARLLQLEHAQAPPADLWPAVRAYLEGLERASFDHHLPALLDAETAVYVRLGLPPGTAARLALHSLGAAHGPLLQHLVAGLRRVAAERREAGDGPAAALCDRLARRVLRQWTLDAAPAGLRLLAADLLADWLSAGPEPPAAADSGVADGCRDWRAAYRSAARTLPPPPPLLSVSDVPTPAWHRATCLARRLALTAWLAAALGGAAVAALATAAFWLRSPRADLSARRTLAAVLAVLAVAAAGCAVVVRWPELVQADCQRASDRQLGLPRLPLAGAAAGVLAAGLTGILGGGRSAGRAGRWARCGGAAGVAWLALGIALLGSATATEARRRTYEQELAAAAADPVGSVAGPGAERLLEPVWSWSP